MTVNRERNAGMTVNRERNAGMTANRYGMLA